MKTKNVQSTTTKSATATKAKMGRPRKVVTSETVQAEITEPIKAKRGRPKNVVVAQTNATVKMGRPRKVATPETVAVKTKQRKPVARPVYFGKAALNTVFSTPTKESVGKLKNLIGIMETAVSHNDVKTAHRAINKVLANSAKLLTAVTRDIYVKA